MARRVFFSFHYEDDIWRANQVRNSNVVVGVKCAGFFDHSEYQEAKKKSSDELKRLIQRKISGTSVTVVLIGSKTANRRYVKYEIAQSIVHKNGLLGIYIHHLKDQRGNTTARGAKPAISAGVEFPTLVWHSRDLGAFRKAIEAAGKRADAYRA